VARVIMVAATIQSTKRENAILRESGIAAVPCSRNFYPWHMAGVVIPGLTRHGNGSRASMRAIASIRLDRQ
jgi:hypothetical protein